MLVLTRKTGEQIYIGEDVVVTVVAVDGGRVRLGIKAPPHVRILREELATRMDEAEHSMALEAVAR